MDRSSVEDAVATIREKGRYALDLETTGLNPKKSRIISASFATDGKTFYFPFVGPKGLPLRETLDKLKQILCDQRLEAIFHNAKFDMQCLACAGYEVLAKIIDTMIAAWMLDETLAGSEGLGLRALAMVELKMALRKFSDFSTGGDLFSQGPGIEQKGIDDARATLLLWKKLSARLSKDPGLWKCFWDLEMPIVRLIAEMELSGVVVDVQHFYELKKKLQKEVHEIELRMKEIAGHSLLVTSTEQVSELLFDQLKLEPKGFMKNDKPKFQLKKTRNGKALWSVSKEILIEYKGVEAVDLLMRHRKLSKLVGTYMVPFIDLASADPESRLRTHFWQVGTESGRLSSSDPVNLQNLPRSKGMVRKGIIAPPGCTLIAADYSQLELRLMADRSRDPDMMRVYIEKQDIHEMTRVALGIEDRTIAKNVNFGLLYGMAAAKLQWQLWVGAGIRAELSDCQRWIIRFFERYPGVKRYHNEIDRQIKELGYVQSLVGRYRRLKELAREDPGHAFRVGVNFTIQGSAADLALIAMRNLQNGILARRAVNQAWHQVRVLAQVHDSLLVQAPEQICEEALILVKSSMENAVVLPSGVPLVSNAGIGLNWEDAEQDAKAREVFAKVGEAKMVNDDAVLAAIAGARKDCKDTVWAPRLDVEEAAALARKVSA